MKKDIILCGVGGQGLILMSKLLTKIALQDGLQVTQSEIHGMSQRGGAVNAHVRISDREIFSYVIKKGQAGIIASLEPLEALRYVDYLKEDGEILTGVDPVVNIANYPEAEAIDHKLAEIGRVAKLPLKEKAQELKTPKSENIILLGALVKKLGLNEANALAVLKETFPDDKNESAMKAGFAF